MIGDENSDISRLLKHSFTKVNATPNPGKPTTWLLRRTATEEAKLKTWVLLDCPLLTRPGRQTIRSNYFISIFIPCHVQRGGEGGCNRKGWGVLRSEYQAGYRWSTRPNPTQSYPTIPYTSPDFQIICFGLDAINNPRKCISSDTILLWLASAYL